MSSAKSEQWFSTCSISPVELLNERFHASALTISFTGPKLAILGYMFLSYSVSSHWSVMPPRPDCQALLVLLDLTG